MIQLLQKNKKKRKIMILDNFKEANLIILILILKKKFKEFQVKESADKKEVKA